MVLDTNVDGLAKIIQRGVASELEQIIRARLEEVVDPIISKMARDIAKQTTIQMDAMMTHGDPFGPKTQVMIRFNNKDVNYVDHAPQDRN